MWCTVWSGRGNGQVFFSKTAHVGGFALTPPPIVSNQVETLNFEFSMSKIGGAQVFNNNLTNSMEKI